MVGNFIGDFVKGNQIIHYDDSIIEGILMHRKIDDFTDNHPVFRRSRKRIRHKYRHYSGVIIDLFYDHILAKNWDEYAEESLDKFVHEVYSVIQNHIQIIPEKARYMLPYMMKHNWLLNYSTLEGIDLSLKGLSKRTNHRSGMEHAAADLREKYNQFENDFKEFFPEIITFISG